jgi:deoxyribodipyrimidine photo-lyase
MYHAEDLPFVKNIPDVFTQFRRKTELDATIRAVFQSQTLSSPEIWFSIATRRIRLSLHLLILVLPYNLGRRNRALARLNHYFYETKIFLFTKKRETEWWAKIILQNSLLG